MGIKVIYKNNKRGEIENYILDDLIRNEKIKAFYRSTGWVVIGQDPIRQMWLKSISGSNDRRRRQLPPDYFF
ncbi:MAG: hypothetical protein WCG31_07765 [Deltaproteobacteria bacterium]|jgi:hypothetical protein